MSSIIPKQSEDILEIMGLNRDNLDCAVEEDGSNRQGTSVSHKSSRSSSHRLTGG